MNSLRPLVAPLAVDSYALERDVLKSHLAGRMLWRGATDLLGVALLPGELRKPLGFSRNSSKPPTTAARPSASVRLISAQGPSGRSRAIRGLPVGADVSSFDGIEAGLAGSTAPTGPARTLAANVNLWPRAWRSS